MLFIVTVLTLSGCTVSNQTFSDADNWIPADFDSQKDVILVETLNMTRKSNDAMQDWLSNKYSGRYVVLDKEAILSKKGKYANTKQYRYAFMWQEIATNRHLNSGIRDIDAYGHFYDRLNDKEYPTTKKFNNYGDQAYVPFFNSIAKHTPK